MKINFGVCSVALSLQNVSALISKQNVELICKPLAQGLVQTQCTTSAESIFGTHRKTRLQIRDAQHIVIWYRHVWLSFALDCPKISRRLTP